MKWIAIRQRVPFRGVMIPLCRLWSSGYLVNDKDDIVDAFWVVPWPGWRYQYAIYADRQMWHRAHIAWIRSMGFRLMWVPLDV